MRLDDLSIHGDLHLLRALPVDDWWTVEANGPRASSLAFYDGHTQETSCHFDSPERRAVYAARYPGRPAARFAVAQARECGFNVTPDPDGDDLDHVVLTLKAAPVSRKVYQRACKQLALLSTFIPGSELASGAVY